jgi:hypothetical protein
MKACRGTTTIARQMHSQTVTDDAWLLIENGTNLGGKLMMINPRVLARLAQYLDEEIPQRPPIKPRVTSSDPQCQKAHPAPTISGADTFLRHCERSEAIQRLMQAAPGLLRR